MELLTEGLSKLSISHYLNIKHKHKHKHKEKYQILLPLFKKKQDAGKLNYLVFLKNDTSNK